MTCKFLRQTDRQTDKQTDRQRQRQTQRETDTERKTDRQTDRETETETDMYLFCAPVPWRECHPGGSIRTLMCLTTPEVGSPKSQSL